MADDAGGGGEDFRSLAAGDGGGQVAHLDGVFITLRAGAGIGVAAVDHAALYLPGTGQDVLAGDLYRRGDDLVGGENGGGGGGIVAEQEADIGGLPGLDARK